MGNTQICYDSEQKSRAEIAQALYEINKQKDQQDNPRLPNAIPPFEQKNEKKGEQTIPQTNPLLKLIQQNWPVYALTKNLLEGFSYTEEFLINIAKMGADAIIAIENNETPKEKKAINDFMSSKKDQILQGKLYYDDILKLLQKNFEENKLTLKPSGKKRTFLQMAKIKKKQKQMIKNTNDILGFQIVYSTNYKDLNEDEIEEAIKLQHIGQVMKELGEELSFKILQMKQKTEKMRQLLTNTLLKNIKQLENFKPIGDWRLDMNPLEVQIISKIARQACEYYQNGVYILLVYFNKSCKSLQSKYKESISNIQLKLKDSIELIAYLYPPGQGLNKSDPDLEEKLKRLEKKMVFESKVHQFNQNSQDQQKFKRLKEIIIQHAVIARDNKKYLERLIRQTCLKRCIDFTTGLKYNPDKHNDKALTRIQEKLLFKTSMEFKRQNRSTIDEVIKQEQTEYENLVKKQLSKKKDLTFTISDMVRGKCIFLSIQDIVQTIDDINKFIQKQNESNPGFFKIYEVQSRFTRQPPISDITLKIGINSKILAQLQLTLQTNKAAYNFAHKIYEFNRAKVFSKIKVISNYYLQYTKDFTEMAEKQLNNITEQAYRSEIFKFISQKKDSSSQTNKPVDRQYQKDLLLTKIGENLAGKLQKETNYMEFTKDDQQYMKYIIQLKAKINQKNVIQLFVKQLNQCLGNENIKEQQKALQLYFYLSDRKVQTFILESQSLKKVNNSPQTMLKYILQLNTDNNVFKANPKLYLHLQKLFEILENKYANQKIIHRDLLKADHAIQNIESLQKLAVFYYRQKKSAIFSNIYDYLVELSKKNKTQNNNLAEIKLLKIQSLILQNKFDNAISDLNLILTEFKEKKNIRAIIESQILLAQCYLNKQIRVQSRQSKQSKQSQQHQKQYNQFYQWAEQQSKQSGLQLKGELIGESSWRMAEIAFLKRNCTQQEKRRVINTHYRIAFSQFAKYKSFQQLEKIKDKWLYFQKYYLEFPQKRHFTNIVKGSQKHTFIIGSQRYPNVYEFMKYYLYMKNVNLKHLQLQSDQKIQKKYWELIQEVSIDHSTKLDSFKISIPEVNNFACNSLSHFSNLKELVIRSEKCGNNIWKSVSKQKMPHLQILRLTAEYSTKQILEFMHTQLSVITLNLQKPQYSNCIFQITALEHTIWRRSQVDLQAKLALPNLMLMQVKNKIPIIQQLYIYKEKIQMKQNKIIKSKELYNKIFQEFIIIINRLKDSQQSQNLFQLQQWQTVANLKIDCSLFTEKGATYCSKANFKAVTQLSLYNKPNFSTIKGIEKLNIDKDNILELSIKNVTFDSDVTDYMLGFKNLIRLNASHKTLINNEFKKILSTCRWKNITHLNLNQSNIGEQGCKYLANGQWDQLIYLNIRNNNIGDNGSKLISQASWTKLTSIILSSNLIGKKGCSELSKAKWNKNIINIDLSYNQIQRQATQELSQAQWMNLASINLDQNKIDFDGWNLISKAKWNKLTAINLGTLTVSFKLNFQQYWLRFLQQKLYCFLSSCFRSNIKIFSCGIRHYFYQVLQDNCSTSNSWYETDQDVFKRVFPSFSSTDWNKIDTKIQEDWAT